MATTNNVNDHMNMSSNGSEEMEFDTDDLCLMNIVNNRQSEVDPLSWEEIIPFYVEKGPKEIFDTMNISLDDHSVLELVFEYWGSNLHKMLPFMNCLMRDDPDVFTPITLGDDSIDDFHGQSMLPLLRYVDTPFSYYADIMSYYQNSIMPFPMLHQPDELLGWRFEAKECFARIGFEIEDLPYSQSYDDFLHQGDYDEIYQLLGGYGGRCICCGNILTDDVTAHKHYMSLESIEMIAHDFGFQEVFDHIQLSSFLRYAFLMLLMGNLNYQAFCQILLMHDVETNPGPCVSKCDVQYYDVDKCNCTYCRDYESYFKKLLTQVSIELCQGGVTPKTINKLRREYDLVHGVYKFTYGQCLDMSGFVMQMFGLTDITCKIDPDTFQMLNTFADGLLSKVEDVAAESTVHHEHTHVHTVPSVTDLIGKMNSGISAFITNLQDPTVLCTLLAALMAMNYMYPSPSLKSVTTLVGIWAFYQLGSTKFLPHILNMIGGFTTQSLDEDLIDVMGELVCFGFFGKNLSFNSFDEFSSSFSLFERGGSNLEKFTKRLVAWFKKIFAILGDHFGIACFQQYGEYKNRLENIQLRLQAILNQYDAYTKQDPAGLDPLDTIVNIDFCTRVKQIDDEVRAILIDLKQTDAASQTVRNCLTEIKNRLMPLLALAELAGMDKGRRCRPYLFGLGGVSGVGKTVVLEDASSRLDMVGRSAADLADMKINKSRRIYPVKKGQKHFDGYTSQSVIMIADMFTEIDVPGMPGEAAFVINNIGNNPDPLPAAALHNKEKIMSKNRIFSFASNRCYFEEGFFKSINNPEAVVSRVNYNFWKVIPAPGWGVPSDTVQTFPPGETDPRFIQKINVPKLIAEHPNDIFYNCYDFIAWDVSNNRRRHNELQNVFSADYEGFMAYQQYKFDIHLRKESRNMIMQDNKLNTTIDEIRVNLAHGEVFRPRVFVPQSSDIDWETMPGLEDDSDSVSYYSIDSVAAKVNAFTTGDICHDEIQHVMACAKDDQMLPLSQLLGTSDDFLNYVKICYKHRSDCQFPPFYNNDINHPYTLIVEKLRIEDIEVVFKLEKDKSFTSTMLSSAYERIAPYMAKGKDFYHSTILSMRDLMNTAVAELSKRMVKPLLWCIEHPIASFALGVGATAIIFWGLFKFMSSLCSSVSNVVSNLVSSLEDDVPVEFKPQGDDIDSHTRSCMESRLQACYQVTLVRTLPDGSVVKRSPCSMKFIGEFTGKTVAHLYWMWKQLESKGSTNFKIYLTSFHNTIPIGKEGSFNYMFDIEDIIWDLDPSGRDRVYMTFPKGKITMQSHLMDEYPSSRDVDFISWLKDGKKKDAVAAIKLTSGFMYKKCKVWYDGINISYNYNTLVGDNTVMAVPFNHDSCTLKSDLSSLSGWCGAEVWLTDHNMKKFGKRYSNPLPVYEHIGMSGSVATGIMTFEEDADIIAHRIKYKSKHTSKEVVDNSAKMQEKFAEALRTFLKEFKEQDNKVDYNVDELVELLQGESDVTEIPEIPKFTNVLEHVKPPKIMLGSSIKRSKVYDDVLQQLRAVGHDRTRKPIKTFKHINSKGVHNNPLAKATAAYGSKPQEVPLNQTEFIVNKVITHIYNVSNKPEEDKKKTLTFREFMEGMDGERKKPKDKTSAGYTFTILKESLGLTGKGRTWIWNNEEGIDFDSPFVKALDLCVEYNIAQARSGQRIMNINVDHLKDELRTDEKCEDGKARLYCAQELVYLIICGMMFYPFVNWIVQNRIKNGSLVGINPYGDEWKQFFTHLMSKNDRGVFGDYGSYDKTLFIIWQRSCQKLYKLFYGPNHPDIVVMDMIFEDMINSYHVINVDGNGFMYKWSWGNTSGNFLTTIINTTASYCLITFACVSVEVGGLQALYKVPLSQLGPIVDAILRDMSFSGYGDDNAFTIRPNHDKVDFFSVQNALKEIGVEYTDEQKGKVEEVALKRVIDGSMIGRGIKIEPGFPVRIGSPLRLYSIIESWLWKKTGSETDEIISQKFRMGAAELSQHGPSTFNIFYPIILDVCAKHGIEPPEFSCYEDARNYVASIAVSPYEA